jgi:hypothetical protein
MVMTKTLIAIGLILIGVIVYAYVSGFNFWNINNLAQIKTTNISVYKNGELNEPLTFINWGIVSPDQTANQTFYLANEGNVPITAHFNTSSYLPSNVISYLDISWNYTGTPLNPLEAKPVTMFLHIQSTVSNITDFSFDINIWGE